MLELSDHVQEKLRNERLLYSVHSDKWLVYAHSRVLI
jgi:hypothetical protein